MKMMICKICGKEDEYNIHRGRLCRECCNKQVREAKQNSKIKCKECGKYYYKNHFIAFGKLVDVCCFCRVEENKSDNWDLDIQIKKAVVKERTYEFLKPVLDELHENGELFHAFNLFKQRMLHKQKTFSIVRDKTFENAILCKSIQKYCMENNL